MSDSSEPKWCPKCGLPIPDGAPQGLCPKCVLAQASIPTDGGKGRPAPSLEEVAAAFPQLEILELIGQGGMGFVFKARQPKLERLVALKILPQALAADPAFAERFTREGRVLARLNHPNIVAIHDFGQAGSFFYLLMEFVDGVNLRQAMQAGRFTPAQALVVVPKICEALQFAHDEGVLHRDIKPENILVDVRGRVKIADFGIAKLLEDAKPGLTLTGSGATLGTPHYMAPEQLEKPGTVDHRADIYSLGVVFYEMLTGELPLGRFQPPSQKVEMDVRLDEVVLHALEKEPARRYQQASQVKTAVETIASGAAAPGQAAPAPPGHFPKRKESVLALAGSALALCLACFGMFLAIEGKSVLVVVVVMAAFSLLLLVFAWNEFLKKTSVEAIASGAAPPIAPAQPVRAPAAGRFWGRFVVGIAFILLGLFLFLAGAMMVSWRLGREGPHNAPGSIAPVPVAAGGTEKEGAALVMDSVAADDAGQNELYPDWLGSVYWDFKYLIPADHRAQFLFVVWSNGVPTVNTGLSGYVEVGPKPLNTENASIEFRPYPRGHPTNVARWEFVSGFCPISGGLVTNQPPFRTLETAPRYILHSGHQLAIRLAEFVQPAGAASNGWSGVELRLILQPLASPPVQTDPNEVATDYSVSGAGLAGTSEDSILKMIKELPTEAPALGSSLRASRKERSLAGQQDSETIFSLAKANIPIYRRDYGENHPMVKAEEAIVKEFTRQSTEEPNMPDDLRKAKAKLAGLRAMYGEEHPAVKEQEAVVEEMRPEQESAQLVIDSLAAPPLVLLGSTNRPDIGDMGWDFNYLIPANHLAQIILVEWSNGGPSIHSGLNAYFKTGQKPVNIQNMMILYEAHASESDPNVLSSDTNVAQWFFSPGSGYTHGRLVTNMPPLHKLETAPRSVLQTGHQLAIRLAEGIPPAGAASNGWSGVELRLILQPLTSPAVQTDPNEVVHDNYVAGWGLAGKPEDAILKLIKELPVEAQPAEKGP